MIIKNQVQGKEDKMAKRVILVVMAGIVLISLLGLAKGNAAQFPTKVVTIVCHARAGGGADTFARQLSKYAEKHLGQSVVVINKMGGRGSTAMSYVYRQPADGYTVMTITPSVVANWAASRAPISNDEFIGITRAQRDLWMIAVPADSQFKNIDELISYAKQQPGEVQWAGFEIGTHPHMIGYELAQKAGFELTWVPYGSGGPVVTALLGHHQNVGITAVSVLRSHLEAGTLKPLAIAAEKRSSISPKVPTLKEKGYDINLMQWRGIIARKGIPADRIRIVFEAFRKAMQEPGWKDYMKKAGMEEECLSPNEFSEAMKKEMESIRAYMKRTGMIK